MAKQNKGTRGIDGVTSGAIEKVGVMSYVEQMQSELINRTYCPLPARKVEIPKDKNIGLQLNEGKSKVVDFHKGQSFEPISKSV